MKKKKMKWMVQNTSMRSVCIKETDVIHSNVYWSPNVGLYWLYFSGEPWLMYWLRGEYIVGGSWRQERTAGRGAARPFRRAGQKCGQWPMLQDLQDRGLIICQKLFFNFSKVFSHLPCFPLFSSDISIYYQFLKNATLNSSWDGSLVNTTTQSFSTEHFNQ